MNYLILVPKLLLKKRIGLYILLSIVLLGTVTFFTKFMIPDAPFNRLQELVRNIQDIKTLRGLPYIMTAITSLSFFLLGGILALTKDFYGRNKIQKENEIQRAETELEFLKAQLNPHFLFNSLNSVYSLVRNKSKDAPEAVITLSELMRYMLYEANQDKVLLSKEMDYIKNYVSLQRLRLSNSENVKLLIRGDYDDRKIAPLLLITFIENAFKYGTDFKGRTKVDIRIEVMEKELFFHITNLIGPTKVDRDNSGIGLKNVENRLDFLYPESHCLDIRKANGDYIVDLQLTLD
ncbi:MAG: histidine kinase [Bacteroidota bacterium]